jgi:hypothetical protein
MCRIAILQSAQSSNPRFKKIATDFTDFTDANQKPRMEGFAGWLSAIRAIL